MAMLDDHSYNYAAPPVQANIRHQLTVDDVVKLASAGLKIDIRYIELIDPVQRPVYERYDLMRPLLERIHRAYAKHNDVYIFNPVPLRHVSVCEMADAIHVFVMGMGGKPAVFEDSRKLYPSDTLMANIHLYIETQPKIPETDTMGIGMSESMGQCRR